MEYDYEQSEDARTIYCGNIASKVTEELLYELFLQAGPLERVFIPTDREGRLASYGFITYKHRCSVDYALNLFEGIQLYNCRLNLKHRRQDTSAPNSPQIAMQMPLPFVQSPMPIMNQMAFNLPIQVPLSPVFNNHNRTPTGRNDYRNNNEQFRNESLQGRFSNYSKRDRDKMRPNEHRHYKKHRR